MFIIDTKYTRACAIYYCCTFITCNIFTVYYRIYSLKVTNLVPIIQEWYAKPCGKYLDNLRSKVNGQIEVKHDKNAFFSFSHPIWHLDVLYLMHNHLK